MRHGRSWSGYCLPAPLAPSKNPSDIALLEGDPQLARDIYAAREQIWSSLLEVSS